MSRLRRLNSIRSLNLSNKSNSALLEAATAAASHSYSPYSRFRVGATVRVGDKLFSGCNIENASYGLTICAERVAIFKAVSEGGHRIDEIAVVCVDAPENNAPESRMPCGACLQVMAQFSAPTCLVHVGGVGSFALRDLLPKPFRI